MPGIPYMNMNFNDLSQMPPVNEIPQRQKLKKSKEPEKQLTMKGYSGTSRDQRQAG